MAPCGTPCVMLRGSEVADLMRTNCFLSVKKFLNQSTTLSEAPIRTNLGGLYYRTPLRDPTKGGQKPIPSRIISVIVYKVYFKIRREVTYLEV